MKKHAACLRAASIISAIALSYPPPPFQAPPHLLLLMTHHEKMRRKALPRSPNPNPMAMGGYYIYVP